MDPDLAERISHYRHDDALGAWSVASCVPCDALRPFVSTLWLGEGRVSYQRDRILPNSESYLLINLGPPQYLVSNGAPSERIIFRDVWYSGLRETPIETEAPHGSRLLGVAFQALGARPWLHIDAQHTAGHVLSLAELLGDSVLQLREALLNCTGLAPSFALVERWLCARLRQRYQAHALVPWALQQIAAHSGQIEIQQLAQHAGVSRKYLTNLFRRDVGLAPKALARVHRFKAALALLAQARQVPWSELAAQCGYYDQSHLVRDFQAFSGVAPSEFIRLARPDGTSVVVA